MKIVILKNNLKNALDLVGKAVGHNSNLPILSNVLIKTLENKVRVVSTNLEIGIASDVSGKVVEDGGITVPYDLIYGIVSNLSSERVNLEAKNNNLLVKTDNYEASLQGINESEFPIIPKVGEKNGHIEFDQGVLKRALDKVVIAAGENNLRPEINSVLIVVEPSVVKFVATDSFRLAEARIEGPQFKNTISEGFKAIVPLKTAQIISRVLKEDGEEKVSFYFDGSQMLTRAGGTEIISRLVDGKFPDYEAIVPKSIEAETLVNRAELVNALKLANSFAAKAKEVKVRIKDKRVMEIYSSDAAIGENKYLIPVKSTGGDFEVTFNLSYLLDGVRSDASE